MKSHLLDLTQDSPLGLDGIQTSISFSRFVQHIQQRKQQDSALTKMFFEMVLNKFLATPSFSEAIPLGKSREYQELMGLVYSMLVPNTTEECDVLMAFSTPIRPTIFYGTDAFYDLIQENKRSGPELGALSPSGITLTEEIQLIYGFILEQLYGFPPFQYKAPVVTLRNKDSRTGRFYRLAIDNSYASVEPIGTLPDLELDTIRQEWQEDFDPAVLLTILPLTGFRFHGFSIITLTDVTTTHTIENMQNSIINRGEDKGEAHHDDVTQSLRMLVEEPTIEFGLVPLLKVNGITVFDSDSLRHSQLFDLTYISSDAKEMYLSLAQRYFQAPQLYFMSDTSTQAGESVLAEILLEYNIKSCAFLPVLFERHVVGVMIICSAMAGAVNEKMLSRLDPALPIIAQLLQNDIEAFDATLEDLIRENFTPLQPAVEWKFRQTAWQFLREKAVDPEGAVIRSISFKDVYPLFGSVDIRNSTLERNKALRADLTYQFESIIDLFSLLKKQTGFPLASETVRKCRKILSSITEEATPGHEMTVRNFLEKEIHPFLHLYTTGAHNVTVPTKEMPPLSGKSAGSRHLDAAIVHYYESIDPATGTAFAHRRALERSMQRINATITSQLDTFRKDVEQIHPVFFEKFRTDGIEYDLYTGQSIEPYQAYADGIPNDIRFRQLACMADIVKRTHQLVPELDKPLLTTQLIFIHPGTIDITFRDDERRFDVEGAYNIRYQMIKKRIDKVHVNGTGERLTQPGKIALVYFSAQSAEEYGTYIQTLQKEGVLQDNLEHLELEELQGVYELKALRVGVALAASENRKKENEYTIEQYL